jgi:hypothetical protein
MDHHKTCGLDVYAGCPDSLGDGSVDAHHRVAAQEREIK